MYSERANFNSTILPNKLSPEHIKWKLVADFSSKHCKSTLSNLTHDPYHTHIT